MSDNIIMPEILAPAGNAECAETAINAGADAIYLGVSAFSARAGATNFDLQALCAVIERAHFSGVKVYVAMNTLVKDAETEEFIKTLLEVWNTGADAIIMQDVLLGRFVHERYPEIILHLSTQAGVNNLVGAKYAKECGFSRVILARETRLKEIKDIAAFMETEVFVQGALCTCFSGQCYFSSFAGGNSGNRGRCKQPCRKLYSYDRNGYEKKAYALSLSDLCVAENLEKFRSAGVSSFKIEGRMRRAEYVAAAVRYYRMLLDGTDEGGEAAALSDLKRTYNRGDYTKGLAFGQDKRFLSRSVQGHLGEKVGVVRSVKSKYFVESSFRPEQGDGFKLLRKGSEIGGAVFEKLAENGFYIQTKARPFDGDEVFITTDSAVNRRVLSDKKLLDVDVSLNFTEGKRAVVLCGGVETQSAEILQKARSAPLTKEELTECFLKTDSLPVRIRFSDIKLSENVFMAKSALNALRRETYARFYESRVKSGNIEYTFKAISCSALSGSNKKKAVIISGPFRKTDADIVIYKPQDYAGSLPDDFVNGAFEKYLYYPAFGTERELSEIAGLIEKNRLNGIYAENYGGVVFAREHNIKIFAGTGFNLTNRLSVNELLKESVLSYYAISKELCEKEQSALKSERAFVLAGGGVKLMDLVYCPFGKSCPSCDKRALYTLTDENGRSFPVRRYKSAEGACRFEVYNCADLSDGGPDGLGKLFDLTLPPSKNKAYTSGHRKKSML